MVKGWGPVETHPLAELYELLPSVQMHELLLSKPGWYDAIILVTRRSSGSSTQGDSRMPPDADVTARECVDAALGSTQLLPEKPTTQYFKPGTWWSLVHCILKALWVLLPFGISWTSRDDTIDKVVPAITKFICWLRWLRERGRIATKALKPIMDVWRLSFSWAESRSAVEEDNGPLSLLKQLRSGASMYQSLHTRISRTQQTSWLNCLLPSKTWCSSSSSLVYCILAHLHAHMVRINTERICFEIGDCNEMDIKSTSSMKKRTLCLNPAQAHTITTPKQ